MFVLLTFAWMHPNWAGATLPTISSVTIANPYSPANTMIFQATVVVSGSANDADHDARVGYAVHGTNCTTGTWRYGHSQRYGSVTSLTWSLYNFVPGTQYDYKVSIGHGPFATQCGTLGTPTPPTNLGYLAFDFARSVGYNTNYILLDTDDCFGLGSPRRYLVALDTHLLTIVWYLDVVAIAGIGGDTTSGWTLPL